MTTFTYDLAGQLTATRDALLRDTAVEYDNLGRQTKVTDELGQWTKFAYDALGNMTAMTDYQGFTTTTGFDRLDRPASLRDPRNGLTAFRYDAASNLTALVDAALNTTMFEYDRLDRRTANTNQLGGRRTFAYDAASNLTKMTDRRGQVREFVFDNLNRQTQELWKSGTTTVRTVAYTFNAADEITNATDADSAYAYTYDNLGRVLTVSNGGTPNTPTVTLTSGYDVLSRRTSLAANVSGTADFLNSYSYDTLDRLTRVDQTGNGGNTVAEKRVDLAYNALGQFTSIARYKAVAGGSGNEVATSTFSYDALARLTALDHKKGAANIANYTWTFDTLNRVATFGSPDGTATYKYDATSQLTTVTNTVLANESYVNDLNGNRASKGTANTTTGDNNRLTSDGTYNYEYDAEGNRTRRVKISDNTSTEYDWDYRNRLTEVREKNAGGTVTKRTSYTYDVYDRRLAKVIDPDGDTGSAATTVRRFVYDGHQIALAFDASGTIVNRYLHGDQLDFILADEQGSTTYWPLVDNLGTVRDLVDSTGTVQNHLKYDAYGNVVSESNGAIDHLFGFTGRERDEETGLMYYRARYYDAAVGKFLNEDPIGFGAGDANLSRYVGNAPTLFVDPSGKTAFPSNTLGNGGPFGSLAGGMPTSPPPGGAIYGQGPSAGQSFASWYSTGPGQFTHGGPVGASQGAPGLFVASQQLVFGFANGLTGGGTHKINTFLWGDTYTFYAQGPLFDLGTTGGQLHRQAINHLGGGGCAGDVQAVLAGIDDAISIANGGIDVVEGVQDGDPDRIGRGIGDIVDGVAGDPTCFVAGTLVWRRFDGVEVAGAPINGGAEDDGSVLLRDENLVWAAALVGVGIAGQQLADRRARRKNERDEEEEEERRKAIEELFGDSGDEDLDDSDRAMLPQIHEFALEFGVEHRERFDWATDSLGFECGDNGPVVGCLRQTGTALVNNATSPQPRPARAIGAPTRSIRGSTSGRLGSRNRAPGRTIAGKVWLASCLLLAAVMGLSAFSPSRSQTPPLVDAQGMSGVATPIERIRVGQRVVGRNPSVAADGHDLETAVDQKTWKLVRLSIRHLWHDGTVGAMHVESLQPPEWIERNRVVVGGMSPIPFDLVEMGLPRDLHARVEAIEACPPLDTGSGSVVLTTIDHLNRSVVELTVVDEQGRLERIRPTIYHKIFRESDGAWLSAVYLQPGDILRGLAGPLTVVSSRRIEGAHRVYNITVEHEHVYDVGSLGLLVHNGDNDDPAVGGCDGDGGADPPDGGGEGGGGGDGGGGVADGGDGGGDGGGGDGGGGDGGGGADGGGAGGGQRPAKIDSIQGSEDAVKNALRGGDEDELDEAIEQERGIREEQRKRRKLDRRFRSGEELEP